MAKRPRCRYGASCYRRNPEHTAAFCHPCDKDWGDEEAAGADEPPPAPAAAAAAAGTALLAGALGIFDSDDEADAVNIDEGASEEYWAAVDAQIANADLADDSGEETEDSDPPNADGEVVDRGLKADPQTLQAAGELLRVAAGAAQEAWGALKRRKKKGKHSSKGKGRGKGAAHGGAPPGAGLSLMSPPHWSTMQMPPERWRLIPVLSRRVKATLQKFLKVYDPTHLGVGRDQVEAGKYSSLQLEHAWRLEHEHLWALYSVERQRIVGQRKGQLHNMPREQTKLERTFPTLPQEMPGPKTDPRINEKFLLHGTKPDTVVAILQGGLNERYSGGLFGNAVYLAEDAEKIDQYVCSDKVHNPSSELHKRIYRGGGHFTPKVFYCFVVRAVLGFPCKTKDSITRLEDGGKVFGIAGNTRVLGYIPGTTPANTIQYHSLIAELGGKLSRHREFMLFDGDLIYPEYLLAYKRV